VTPPIASLIREGKAFQIPSLMKTGSAQGMVMLHDALLALVNEQVVAPQEAYMKALDKTAFTEMLKKNGCDTSFLLDLEGRATS
jgi:twitching motility protein PilT